MARAIIIDSNPHYQSTFIAPLEDCIVAALLPLLTERDAAREEMERLREEKDGSDEAVVSLMADVERLAAERDTLRQQLTRASATTLELATAVEHLTQTWAEHKATMTALTAALVEAWAEGRAGRGTACALLPTADDQAVPSTTAQGA